MSAGEAVARRGAQVLTAVSHGGASEGGAGKAVRAWRRAGEACKEEEDRERRDRDDVVARNDARQARGRGREAMVSAGEAVARRGAQVRARAACESRLDSPVAAHITLCNAPIGAMAERPASLCPASQ